MVNKNDSQKNSGVGMGVGMLAALAAGAYYLYGTKDGAKKRVKIRGWMLKAKGEVLEKMENLKEVNEGTYNGLVENVMKKYQGLKNLDQEEVSTLIADLKRYWKNIKGSVETPNRVKAKVKKAVKRSVKKASIE